MAGPYARFMNDWENRLANSDSNRVERPFEWGLDWLELASGNGNPANDLSKYVEAGLADSSSFFAYRKPDGFAFNSSMELQFPSPIESRYAENNTVHAQYFPSPRSNGRAVLVIPQWNSPPDGHFGLCKLLNWHGFSALRLSLAYHHRRMPPELERADYHMSSNLGRTIHAMRQSVIDTRACLDWLEQQGYHRLGILGTSLGSCVALLAATHDGRLKAGVFNHISMHVAEVVWTGISCRHIRKSLDGYLSLDELRHYWSLISPAPFLPRLQSNPLKNLLIWAEHDTTFRPEYSRHVLEVFQQLQLHHEVVKLPCGHYTSGKLPFNVWDGLAMCNFLYRML